MNKLLDPKIFLTLKETEKGFYLYTNREKQKLIINNGIGRAAPSKAN